MDFVRDWLKENQQEVLNELNAKKLDLFYKQMDEGMKIEKFGKVNV